MNLFRTRPHKIAAAALLLTLLLPVHALANAGPVFMDGDPGFGPLTPMENCPVAVIGEELVFDFRPAVTEFHEGDPTGLVTAAYRMKNQSEEALSLPMVFPFYGRLFGEGYDDIRVTAGGEEAAVALHPGAVRAGKTETDDLKAEALSFSQALDSLLARAEDTDAILLIVRAPAPAERTELTFSFTLAEGQQALSMGFNSYSYDGDTGLVTFGASLQDDRESTLCLLFSGGEAPALTARAHKPGDAGAELPMPAYQTTEEQTTFLNFFLSGRAATLSNDRAFFAPFANLSGLVTEEVAAACLGDGLSRAFQGMNNAATAEDAVSLALQARLMALSYTVDFAPGEEKEVVVTYPSRGEMNRLNTRYPLYTYRYLFQPAGYWASFADLDVTVYPPEEAPYLVHPRGLEFTKDDGTGAYTAHADALPDSDLSFGLHKEPLIDLNLDEDEKPGPAFLLVALVCVAALLYSVRQMQKAQGRDILKGKRK